MLDQEELLKIVYGLSSFSHQHSWKKMQIVQYISRLSHKHFGKRRETGKKFVESLRMASLVNTTEEGYDILQERLLSFFFQGLKFWVIRYVDTSICVECGF
jgi:hypothetical protein